MICIVPLALQSGSRFLTVVFWGILCVEFRCWFARPAQFPHLHGRSGTAPLAGVEVVVAGHLFAEILRQRGKHGFAVSGRHSVISGDKVKAAFLAFGIALEGAAQTGQTRAVGGLGFGGRGVLACFDGDSGHARHWGARVAVTCSLKESSF